MPRNTHGGNRAKGMRNKRPQRALVLKNEAPGCIYGCIVSNLGNGACSVNILKQNGHNESDKPIRCSIRGSVRRQRFIKGDVVLICKEDLTSHGKHQYNIIHKYNADHVQELIRRNEIIQTINNSSFTINIDDDEDEDEDDEELDDYLTRPDSKHGENKSYDDLMPNYPARSDSAYGEYVDEAAKELEDY